MSRALSTEMLAQLGAEETTESVVTLLTITHEDLDAPFRVCDQPGSTRLSEDPLTYGVTSRSNDYLFVPFRLTLPDDKDQGYTRLVLEMDNIERSLIELIRSTQTPAKALVELVLESEPDTVEVPIPALDIVDADYSAEMIRFDLMIARLHREPFPAGSMTPGAFPGLF